MKDAPAARAEYERRMHRVIEHIDRHLDQPLDLERLAAVAHFSPFHFHRLFAAWMGETLGDYLRRRRVETAAMRLAGQPGLPVLSAALSVGFGSAEAFSRAFRARFGSSPTAWRRQNRNPGQVDRKPDQAAPAASANHAGSSHAKESPMEVKLIERPPVTVAYLRHTGPFGPPLQRFWGETVYPWMLANGLLGQTRYGLALDDPAITAPAKQRYDACVEVPQDFVASGPAHKTTLPGGRYATLYFKGTSAEIGAAWLRLLRDWLPGSGLQLDARPCFEHYPREGCYDAATGVFDCELCIPVAPL
ncbi:AraC family transcriptional regulator [Solimonas sp. K1W22B-7]|uniref:AraC family transcriptional regulator n=1 Tax=Solimonas sp. K1W22B-7 TaxID=2303331 RepID=UPI000E333845|nr:AraC family transcriptional regulator [Solimonas sp. K1W22B-7]AXQ29346.1 AraC family transcriptional regulator [Solimonas sp. K1W22B-7]